MESYTKHTHGIQGEPFKDLLVSERDSLPDLLKSFRVYSNLDSASQEKMSFQRELWNVGYENTSVGSKNKDALGVSIGYAKAMAKKVSGTLPGKVPEVLQPGNQLAICMNTPIRTTSGQIKILPFYLALLPLWIILRSQNSQRMSVAKSAAKRRKHKRLTRLPIQRLLKPSNLRCWGC